MKIVIISILFLVLFSGCTREEEETRPVLKAGESVVISKGQRVIPLSRDTKVEINKNSNGDTITVKIIQGSANIE